MIALVDAMSVPFVLFTFVVLGAPTAWFITVKVSASRHEARALAHQEKMKGLEASHAEALAKIKSNDPKMIEGTAR